MKANIEHVNVDQGSEEWLEARKGKLTASQFDKVLSNKSLKYAKIAKEPTQDDLAAMARAKKQAEVLEQLKEADIETRLLNASGLKGLIEKGIVETYEDYTGCSLLGSSTESHINDILGELYYTHGDIEPFQPNAAMQRGTMLEPVARTDFEFLTNLVVKEAGMFINHDISPHIGMSPDGIIGDDSGLEIKCPLPATHLSYHEHGGLPSNYKAQVHGAMAITGASSWHFYSFCPNFKPYHLVVKRDAYTENMIKCLKEFHEIFTEQKTRVDKLLQD